MSDNTISSIQRALEKLENKMKSAKESILKDEGRKQELIKRLKDEFGLKDIDAGKKELRKLDSLLDKQEQEIEEKFTELEKKYAL